jgi:hypothetical protein
MLTKIDFIITSLENKIDELFSNGTMVGARYEFGKIKKLFSYSSFLVEITTNNRGVLKIKSAEVVDSDVMEGYTQKVNLKGVL